MKAIVLKITGDNFVLSNSPDNLHLAFNFIRQALIDVPWGLEIIEYGTDASFWYNIRNTDGDLLYQIRILV